MRLKSLKDYSYMKSYTQTQYESLNRGVGITQTLAPALGGVTKNETPSTFGQDVANALKYAGDAWASMQLQSVNNNLAAQQASAHQAMVHASQEAEKNRQWQEMMSNTAYQRAMRDMKAAGLNPILAYQQGGASTPGGSSAGGYTINGAQGQVNGYARALQAAPALFDSIQKIATSGYARAKGNAERMDGVKDVLNDAFQASKYALKQTLEMWANPTATTTARLFTK